MHIHNIMESIYPNGYLEVAVGPMFSGKTSWLLEIYRQHTYCEKKVMVLNHADDTRYHVSMMSTHDKKMIPCTQLESFRKIDPIVLSEIMESDVILINEGQFFDTLLQFVKMLLFYNKVVYVCGLDGDFKQRKFGEVLDLIPVCDKVHKLHSMCAGCKNGTHAIFSHRIVHVVDSNHAESDHAESTECIDQKLVGTDDLYIPVCRECYNKYNDNTTMI